MRAGKRKKTSASFSRGWKNPGRIRKESKNKEEEDKLQLFPFRDLRRPFREGPDGGTPAGANTGEKG